MHLEPIVLTRTVALLAALAGACGTSNRPATSSTTSPSKTSAPQAPTSSSPEQAVTELAIDVVAAVRNGDGARLVELYGLHDERLSPWFRKQMVHQLERLMMNLSGELDLRSIARWHGIGVYREEEPGERYRIAGQVSRAQVVFAYEDDDGKLGGLKLTTLVDMPGFGWIIAPDNEYRMSSGGERATTESIARIFRGPMSEQMRTLTDAERTELEAPARSLTENDADDSIYYVSLDVGAARVALTLNGFPLAHGGDSWSESAPINRFYPVNQYLIGRGNTLELEATPYPEKGVQSLAEAIVKVRVSAHRVDSGGLVSPREGGTEVALQRNGRSFDGDLSRAARKRRRQPFKARLHFDSQDVDHFRPTLESSTREVAEAELRAFGAALVADLDRGRQRDKDGWSRGIATVTAARIGQPVSLIQPILDASLALSCRGRMQPVEGSELTIRKWGRGIFEIARSDGRPLVLTKKDDDGGWFSKPIYVVKIGDQLHVLP